MTAQKYLYCAKIQIFKICSIFGSHLLPVHLSLSPLFHICLLAVLGFIGWSGSKSSSRPNFFMRNISIGTSGRPFHPFSWLFSVMGMPKARSYVE